MSRISYVIKRVGKMDFERMRETARMLHKKTGKPTGWLLMDMSKCALKYNAGYMDYKIAEMYRLNDAQRRTVITRGISNEIVRRMNDKAYWHFFDDKTEFNTLFSKWIQRDWIKTDDSLTAEKLSAFLEDKDQVIYKPLEGSSGQGIEKYVKQDWKDLPAFTEKIKQNGPAILEEIVIQHPEMARMCPTSVNTVRIATLLGDKQEGIVYAFIRDKKVLGTPKGPTQRLLIIMALSMFFLMFTPTKWTHHFGIYAGIAGVKFIHACVESGKRDAAWVEV